LKSIFSEIKNEIEESVNVKQTLLNDIMTIDKITRTILRALKSKNTVFLLGNGGSAADAQHIAAEFVGRFSHKVNRQALPAVALTTNSSILTAISNDFDFDQVFTRQIEAFVHKNDVVIGLSTSGKSKNVLDAIKLAKKKGAITIGFTGKSKNSLSRLCSITLHVQSNNTQRIQECHITIGHIICGLVEKYLKRF